MVDLAGAPPFLPGDLEGEILTHDEVAPVVREVSSIRSGQTKECPDCGEAFTHAFGQVAGQMMRRHQKHNHYDSWVAWKKDKEEHASPSKRSKTPAPKKPPAPPAKKQRLSGADFLGLFVSGIAAGALRSGIGPSATWLSLMWEAPIAAKALDKLAAGSIADKVIQPIAKLEAEGKGLAATLLLPIGCGLIQAKPQTAPMMYPIVKSAMVEVLQEMVPVIRKQKQEQEKLRATLEELQIIYGDETEEPATTEPQRDFIDGLLDGFFAQMSSNGPRDA